MSVLAQSCRKSGLAVGAIVVAYISVFWFLLPAFLLATGLRLDTLIPVAFAPSGPALALAWLALVAGFAVMVAAVSQLGLYGKGLPISHLPPTDFVTRGLYGRFRHPIYIGFTLAFGGAAALVGSFWSLAFSTPLLLFGWLSYVRFYEEPALVARFGTAYLEYQKTVPVLIPHVAARAALPLAEPFSAALRRLLDRLAQWTMLFRRGRAVFVTNGLFVSVGSLVFSQQIATLFLRQGVRPRHVAAMLVTSALAVIVFTRSVWWLGNRETIRDEPLRGLRRVGYVSWGSPLAFLTIAAVFSALGGYPFLMMVDVFVRGMFANYAIGRIGCLTYGCCWGRTCERGGVEYRNPDAKVVRLTGVTGVSRYPTQLYSSLEGAALFAILNLAASPSLPAGFLTALAFMLYPLGRIWVQFFRENILGNGGSFPRSLVVCAAMFSAAWVLLMVLDPRPGPASPLPWSLPAFMAGLRLWPAMLAGAVLVFFAAGFHWRRIGTW